MGQNLAAIPDASGTIFAVESQSVVNNQINWGTFYYDNDPALPAQQNNDPALVGNKGFHIITKSEEPVFGYNDGSRRYFFRARHLTTGNVLYVDGHAKAQRVESVGALRRNSANRNVFHQWTIEED